MLASEGVHVPMRYRKQLTSLRTRWQWLTERQLQESSFAARGHAPSERRSLDRWSWPTRKRSYSSRGLRRGSRSTSSIVAGHGMTSAMSKTTPRLYPRRAPSRATSTAGMSQHSATVARNTILWIMALQDRVGRSRVTTALAGPREFDASMRAQCAPACCCTTIVVATGLRRHDTCQAPSPVRSVRVIAR